jgi:hypothetical protein
VLPEKEEFDATTFLNSLVKPIGKGGSYFDKLYSLMNDWGGENNFSQLIIELTKIWTFSIYADPFHEKYKKYDIPAPIAYNQNYILGFRNDNYDFEIESTTLKMMYNDLSIPIPGTVRYQTHHIFQPIEVVNLNETEAEDLKLSEGVKIPAFYLKAFDDKSAWENFEKSIWLGVDTLSTATGIGNLAKLRHLIKVEKMAYIILKTSFGIIEVASGTISIGLALIENNKNKIWVNEIREYLFWAEICTLGADVLSSKILKIKARNAQITLKDYQKTITRKQELKNIDEFKIHLDNVLGQGLYGGKVLSKIEIEDWAKLLKNKFGTALKKVDSFDEPTVLAQFDARTNTIHYKEDVTEYIMAHESFHAEEFKKIGYHEYVKDAPIKKDGVPIEEKDLTIKNLIRRYKRERYVYNRLKMEANKFNLNGQERWHIEAYFYEIELSLVEKNIKIPK